MGGYKSPFDILADQDVRADSNMIHKSRKRPRQSRPSNSLHHPTSQLPSIRLPSAGSNSIENGHERTFPPTPPSRSRESVPHFTEHMSNGTSIAYHSRPHRTANSTAGAQKNPLTPDITPPASLSPPQRLIPSRLSSSAAESFKTAREDPWMSGDDISTIPDIHSPQNAKKLDRDLGMGFEEDLEHTPRQSLATFQESTQHGSSTNNVHHVPNREWDTNLMRNVTVRRKKNRPDLGINGTTSHQSVRSINHDPMQISSQPESPVTPTFRSGSNRKPIVISQRRISTDSQSQDDVASKRLSIASNSSTIVEAIIISTPPPKPQTLRHVSKTSSLRDYTGSTNNSTKPGFSHNKSSNHRVVSNPVVRSRVRDDIQSSTSHGRGGKSRVVTDPTLRHQKDSHSLRSDAAVNARTQNSRTLVSQQEESPASSNGQNLSSGSSPPFNKPHDSVHMRQRSQGSRDLADPSYHQIRRSTQLALESVMGPIVTIHPSSTEDSLVTVVKKQTASNHSLDRPARHSRREIQSGYSQNDTVITTEDRLAPPFNGWSNGTKDLVRRTSDASGRSLDRSEYGNRQSVDRSTILSEDHPRQLYSQNTPFSQISARDALEVSEATTVNIYPHNNHSLVMVQQGAKQLQTEPEPPGQQGMEVLERPTIAVQPSTPPTQSSDQFVDSPLRNPRKPPHPPIIKVLPATPSSAIEDPMEVAGGNVPQRRPSLLQRARRYSDNIMQPIIGRSSSLRRHNSERSRPKPDERRANHLHPFWQPRDFWEDVSDSEDDDFYDDRLPPGGDTSEPPPVSIHRRLTQKLPGFRGTGGFLVGNSLGLNRHGTNVRRHHVTLPQGFTAKRPEDEDMIRRSPSPIRTAPRLTKMGSLSSIRSAEAQKRRMRRQWRAMGLSIEYVGIGGVRDFWRENRERKREQRAEKRRQELRNSSGPKFLLKDANALASI
jgi:hypothetical protein